MGKFSLVVLCVHVARSLLWLQPASGQRGAYKSTVVPQELLVLPDLPYDYDELEPFLDAATLEVHHRGHHRAYTSKINTALEKWREQVNNVCILVLLEGACEIVKSLLINAHSTVLQLYRILILILSPINPWSRFCRGCLKCPSNGILL